MQKLEESDLGISFEFLVEYYEPIAKIVSKLEPGSELDDSVVSSIKLKTGTCPICGNGTLELAGFDERFRCEACHPEWGDKFELVRWVGRLPTRQAAIEQLVRYYKLGELFVLSAKARSFATEILRPLREKLAEQKAQHAQLVRDFQNKRRRLFMEKLYAQGKDLCTCLWHEGVAPINRAEQRAVALTREWKNLKPGDPSWFFVNSCSNCWTNLQTSVRNETYPLRVWAMEKQETKLLLTAVPPRGEQPDPSRNQIWTLNDPSQKDEWNALWVSPTLLDSSRPDGNYLDFELEYSHAKEGYNGTLSFAVEPTCLEIKPAPEHRIELLLDSDCGR